MGKEAGMDRDDRVARNERFIRQINWETADEVLSRPSGQVRDEEELVLLCACGRSDCAAELVITVGEYRGVHAHPHRFVIACGHDNPDVERVVDKQPTYWVVEKLPEYRGSTV